MNFLFRLGTLDHPIEQVELFSKQIFSIAQELYYENKHLLNDIVNGVTNDLLTSVAISTVTNEPSTTLGNIIEPLQECSYENLYDSFSLTIDVNQFVYVLIV